jgi:serine/threonine-protein kinase
MADSSSLIGQTFSHYRILEKVGEGGMGVVYKAHDLHLDRFVALKLLPSEKLADETRRQRFVQEAKSASALNHPNIIHIYDVTEANGKPFLAMEYVAGRTLSQVIARKGIGLHEALKIATQIADALAKAHAAGIVHRDLKPSNIMVTQDGLVKVLDFGLAKLTETNSEDSIETRSTKHYSPPRTEEGHLGDSGLHVAGTGRRQVYGCTIGYFLVRGGAVRDVVRPKSFPRREPNAYGGQSFA